MKKIAVVGYKGKMGRPIFLTLGEKFDLVGVGREDSLDEFNDLDLVIDVASGTSSVVSAEYCLRHNIPIIIGSTGQSLEENEKLNEIAQQIKVIKKSNFSIGFEMLESMIDNVLKYNPESVEIVEKHHVNKKDSPSGTALELKRIIEEKCNKEVKISSIREGDEKGEHIIKFKFKNEEISIKHNVFSRQAFVNGVINIAKSLLE